MYDFKVYSPKTLEEALQLKKEKGKKLKIIAGGTDVLVSVRNGTCVVNEVLNISQIEELKGITKDKEFLRIKALVTHNEVVKNPLVKSIFPALSNKLKFVGSQQIRNLGTVMGNICNASPAADSLPLLYCSDATITTKSADKTRVIPIDEFITDAREICIDDSSIATSINIPLEIIRDKNADYISLRQRKSIAINKVGVGMIYKQESDKTLSDIKIALNAVAPTVIRPHEIEFMLKDNKPTLELIEKAGNYARLAVKPIDDVRSSIEYRAAMSETLTKRILKKNLTLVS